MNSLVKKPWILQDKLIVSVVAKKSKSFAQGYCFPCFQRTPETEECVLRPELCKANEGVARDIDFAKEHCLIDHFVFLSYTINIKVRVTLNT